MNVIFRAIQRTTVFHLAWRSIALVASTGAALVTVFSALYSYGVVGKAESHQSIGNIGAAWVGIRPAMDTASAIGDTVHYAATITDKSGSILVGARPTWTTGDSLVAGVLPDGSVIARRPGQTTISVVVGPLVAHARLLVAQRVQTVRFGSAMADSVVMLAEGTTTQLHAVALDSRGHAISGVVPLWQVDDSSVASLDDKGGISGRNAGRTLISATVNGVSERAPVTVVSTAASISLMAGIEQHAFAGNALAQPIVIRAMNRRGAPSPGQMVTFKLAGGQGSVEPAFATTDADGRARTSWTLGEYPGRQTLLAHVDKLDSALAIVAEADPTLINTRVTAVVDNLIGRAGEPLVDSVGVRVTDSSGRALPDIPVRWTAVDGGVVEASALRTDSLGVVHAHWRLAPRSGAQHLRAQLGGSGGRTIPPLVISAKALAGAPATVIAVSGDDQHAQVAASLAKPLVLRVLDKNGSGVSDATVTLSPSGGALSDSTLRTDSLGLVRTRWSMGRATGDYSLAVHVDGVKKLVKLAAHARAASPANLSFDDAPTTHDPHRTKPVKGKHLLALVTDEYGNPVPDVKLSFTAKSGAVNPARAVSDATGRTEIAWVIGSKPGEQILTGLVRGTDVRGRYVVAGATHAPASQKVSSKAPASRKSGR